MSVSPASASLLVGATQQLAATHSWSVEALYTHVPGLKVVEPATPADAKGLLLAASRYDQYALELEDGSLFTLALTHTLMRAHSGSLHDLFAAVAGCLYVHHNTFVSPETFDFMASTMLVVMVALGGTGNYWGAFLGAVIFTALPELLRRRPNAQVLIVGGTDVSYGAAAPKGQTWRDIFLAEVKDRMGLPAETPVQA